MEDVKETISIDTEPALEKLEPDEVTEEFFPEPTPDEYLQQAINRVLTGYLDDVVKKALEKSIRKALQPIVNQAVDKLQPVEINLQVSSFSETPCHASVCPDSTFKPNPQPPKPRKPKPKPSAPI